MPFVLDCSITMAWCFEEESSGAAERAWHELETSFGIVPEIWALEVANTLLIAERKKRIPPGESARFVSHLKKLPIRFEDPLGWGGFDASYELARTERLTSYDAAYLELSVRTGVALATLDAALKKAARKAGVLLLE